MKTILLFASMILLVFSQASCSHLKTARDENNGANSSEDRARVAPPAPASPVKNIAEKDTRLLADLNKAMEDYVHRKDSKNLTRICQDTRFDCFVDNKVFPAQRKKISRTVGPFATGNKFGLHGEDRVQVRYEFFP